MAKQKFLVRQSGKVRGETLTKSGEKKNHRITFSVERDDGLRVKFQIWGAPKIVEKEFKNFPLKTGETFEITLSTTQERIMDSIERIAEKKKKKEKDQTTLDNIDEIEEALKEAQEIDKGEIKNVN